MIKLIFFVGLIFSIIFSCSKKEDKVKHIIAAIEKDKFHGWPANNGIWQWADEILVGFTQGEYIEKEGHNITEIEKSLFSRSLDGGETWQMFKPDGFMDGDNIKWVPNVKKKLEEPLNFKHEGFTMRVFATGYHGNDDPEGGFYYSYDKGANWEGPYYLGNINKLPELMDKEITARTDYIITGEEELYLFISANPQNHRNNRIACIKTEDGGMHFEFVSWVTPLNNDFNTIMSNTVRISENTFILAHRKRYFGDRDDISNSIEVHISEDIGKTWRSLGYIKHFEETVGNDSNPPALVKLQDGRLVCIYGDRYNSRMVGKYSEDGGVTWLEEFIIRDNFKDVTNSTWDFGYPRLVQRNDGKLVAIYYWASSENLQQHIAVSIWSP